MTACSSSSPSRLDLLFRTGTSGSCRGPPAGRLDRTVGSLEQPVLGVRCPPAAARWPVGRRRGRTGPQRSDGRVCGPSPARVVAARDGGDRFTSEHPRQGVRGHRGEHLRPALQARHQDCPDEGVPKVTQTPSTDLDAVVIGAGFGGIYMLKELRDELGLRARPSTRRAASAGPGRNRYPGAKSDTETFVYQYSFDRELLRSGSGTPATWISSTSWPTSPRRASHSVDALADLGGCGHRGTPSCGPGSRTPGRRPRRPAR